MLSILDYKKRMVSEIKKKVSRSNSMLNYLSIWDPVSTLDTPPISCCQGDRSYLILDLIHNCKRWKLSQESNPIPETKFYPYQISDYVCRRIYVLLLPCQINHKACIEMYPGFPKFSQKLHENEETSAGRRGHVSKICLCRSATAVPWHLYILNAKQIFL